MNFFQHPAEVGMTYGEHCRFSLSLAWQFALASAQAVVHALYPDVFVSSSTDASAAIAQQIQQRVDAAGVHEVRRAGAGQQ
jgi:hypothetical protein